MMLVDDATSSADDIDRAVAHIANRVAALASSAAIRSRMHRQFPDLLAAVIEADAAGIGIVGGLAAGRGGRLIARRHCLDPPNRCSAVGGNRAIRSRLRVEKKPRVSGVFLSAVALRSC